MHLPRDVEMAYYRTHAGAEVDIVLHAGRIPLTCIEVKFADAPKLTKGFYHAVEDIQPNHSFIITPNPSEYNLKENIIVCDIDRFLGFYLPEIGK